MKWVTISEFFLLYIHTLLLYPLQILARYVGGGSFGRKEEDGVFKAYIFILLVLLHHWQKVVPLCPCCCALGPLLCRC